MASVTRYPSANNGGWDSNESYGYADDGSYASTAPSVNSTESVEYGNFSFDSLIPADSIINSVTIEAQWYVSTTASSATFRLAALVSNVLKGSEHTDTSEPTSNKDTSYGVTATWSRADLLDGTFEVQVGAQRGSGVTGYTMYLDYVRVVVDYTAPISGEVAITLDAATLSAAGTVASASEISGAAAITLDDLSSSAAGTVDINGAAGISLEAMTGSGAGTVDVQGSASISLDALTCSSAGTVATPSSGYSLVQSKGSIVTGSDSANLSFDATPSVGNLIAVAVASYNGDLGTSAVTDNQGNTYSLRKKQDLGGGSYVGIYRAIVGTASGTFTITVNPDGSSADFTFAIAEFSGNASSPDDLTNGDTQSGTSVNSLSITPTENNSLWIGVMTHGTTDTSITETNGTLIYENQGGSSNMPLSFVYEIQTTAASEAATWTIGASATWGAVIASFKPGGSSGINGTVSITLDALTSSAAGTVDVAGAASITLDALTSSASGTVDVSGAAAIPLDSLVCNAAGAVEVAGAAGISLEDLGLTAAGTVGSTEVSGSADISLEALSSQGTGTVEINGAASIPLDNAGLSAAGTVDIIGAAAVALGELIASAVGTVEIGGAASLSLDPLSMSAEGVVGFTPISGEAAITLGALTVSGAGTVEIVGAAGINLAELGLSAEGNVGFTPITGEASISMESAGLNAAGIVEIHGVFSSNLEGLTAGSTGTVEVAGTASIPLDGLTITATATVSYGVDGSLNVTLGDVSLVASGWAQTIVPIPLTFISRTDDLSISLPEDILTFRDRSDSLTLSLFSDVLELIALSDELTFEE